MSILLCKLTLVCSMALGSLPGFAITGPVDGGETIRPVAARNIPPAQPGQASQAGKVVEIAAQPVQPKQTAFTQGSIGFDISWPQCTGERPGDVVPFAIIGVTGGKAFTENRCLRDQFQWAARANVVPQVYTNLNGVPMGYWDPYQCTPSDGACNAYRYGYNATQQAIAYARSQGADAKDWWLDIETMNYWSQDTGLNAQVVRGGNDALRDAGKNVGVYSTPFQWREIAGGLQLGLPVWTAGAEDLHDAQGRCNGQFAFNGGQVKLVQFIANNFDNNFVC